MQVTADTPVEASPTGCAYAVVATDELAGAVETNTCYDKPAGATTWENGRLWRQTAKGDGFVKAQLSCGQWTYRAAGAPVDATDPLPYATVIVTGDRNGDGKTDWQDAAIALRDIMVMPLGAGEQHLRVVPHIPFNFASQATNPFLATLDHIKRIALATDGLRQFTLLKGYQSEGHDSAHPDYGGNYNERAGGLADLNALLARRQEVAQRLRGARQRHRVLPRRPRLLREARRQGRQAVGLARPVLPHRRPPRSASPATSPGASRSCARRPTPR